MATLTVGPGREFTTLAAAIGASRDGDVIRVDPGTYVNDFATINTKITIEGIGGMVHLLATIPPPDGKAILTINTDATLVNMEFSGAVVADGNGAGIRYQGGNLVLDHTYFHDNQDGLLAASDPTGSITIRNSEFANNGTGDGLTHNLYVNEVGTLSISGSYFHDVNVGHEIKSRALNTTIVNNRIGDRPGGTGSYEIDLPNGGNATIQNNEIEKGPNAQNSSFISFGEEGGVYAGSALSVDANTVLNDRSNGAILVHDVSGGTVSITNNQIYGMNAGQLYSGTGTPSISGNTFLSSEPAFDTSDPFLPVATVACFAEGTRIAGACGEIEVQQLRPGDPVLTLTQGSRVLRPVKWIGYRRLHPLSHPAPETVSPVRVVRGAIAENIPFRDLLLSPDHALYLDGVLIVVRQLINGMTIRQDRAPRSIDYYHIELETHAILLAEGAPAESYLDTGNRGCFANASEPLVLHPDLSGNAARLGGSCAPLHSDEAAVLPIWRRLAHRAAQLGYRRGDSATATDPELRLMLEGRTIAPSHVAAGCHVFSVPSECRGVRLVSRSATPVACRPWLDDRRVLGVAVVRIVSRSGESVDDVPLDWPALRNGWWAVEHDGAAPMRWTDGDALLPLPARRTPSVLEIHLGAAMTYPMDVNGTATHAKQKSGSR